MVGAVVERLHIVIIGGGHSGGRLAQLLARRHDRVQVTVVGSEPVYPYERPPLSKGVLLGTAGLEDCLLWKRDDTTKNHVSMRLGITVEGIDRQRQTVHLSDGTELSYDRLVLATGSRVRQFSAHGSHFRGVLSLRSFANALDVSRQFRAAENVIVGGGGFIGLEVAAAAAQRGLRPRVIEASDRLLSRLVPRLVAQQIAQTHKEAGVKVMYRSMIQRFVSNGHGSVKGAVLGNGETVECDLALIAVGVEPEIGLAVEAGLEMDVGVKTDEELRTSDANIFACGDIASFWHPLYEQRIRLESWQNAEDHARILAAVLLGDQAPSPTVPFFWSDQFDLSLQILGLPNLGSSTKRKRTSSKSTILLHCDPLDRIVGATAVGVAEQIGRELRQTRRLIATRALWDPKLFGATELEVVED